jgi:hypothetical protein
VLELWVSGDLEDSRGAEKGVKPGLDLPVLYHKRYISDMIYFGCDK